MSNRVLEFTIKAVDATGKAITSAISRVKSFSVSVRAMMSKIGTHLKSAASHFGSFAKTVGSNLMNIKAGLDMTVGFVQRFVGQFTGAIMEAFRFEKAVANFKTLLGSIDAAKKHIEELRQFAAATPLTFDDLQQASKLMLSFGMSVETIMPNLKMLGDIAMGDRGKFQGLALVFSQIKAAGRLMGQDLLQMINQGFNPLTIIAEKTGASMVELKKLMENGAIGFDMVNEAMRVATSEGGRFNNAMKDCATTGEGLMSTLQDNWVDAVRTFGNELLDVAKGGIQWCINKIQELKESGAIQEWASKARDAIYSVIGAFNGLSDASTRTQVWEAIKDVLVGGFEEAATKAVDVIIKGCKVAGEVLSHMIEMPWDKNSHWRMEVDVAKEMGYKDIGMWDLSHDGKEGIEKVRAEVERRLDKQAKEKYGYDGSGGSSRLERGLSVLKNFGEEAVKAAHKMRETPITGSAKKPEAKPTKDLSGMLADARNAGNSDKEAAKAERDAAKLAEKIAREQERADQKAARARQKAWDEYVRNMEKDLRHMEKVQDESERRLSAAKDASSEAWGFYMDRESLKKHNAEVDSNIAARDRYEDDYHSLTHGVNSGRFSHLKHLARTDGMGAVEEQLAEWRKKKSISIDTEAAMRVGVANDQEQMAYKYAEETAKNTADAAEYLRLITEGGNEE